jgi:hypothetical protein
MAGFSVSSSGGLLFWKHGGSNRECITAQKSASEWVAGIAIHQLVRQGIAYRDTITERLL